VGHKHQPKHVKVAGMNGVSSVEECEVCGKRRMVTAGTGWVGKTHYSRWVSREDSEKYMLSFIWGVCPKCQNFLDKITQVGEEEFCFYCAYRLK